MLNEILNDPTSLAYDKYIVLDPSTLLDKCPLATKSDFWAELNMQKTLHEQFTCLIVKDTSQLSAELVKELNKLTPYLIDNNSDDTRTLLRYSSDLGESTLYKMEDVKNVFIGKQELMYEINKHVNSGVLKLDKLAQILIVPETMGYFSRFDGITLDDIKEFFHLKNSEAAWVLNMLTLKGVLALESVQMMRITTNSQKWETLVRLHLKEDAIPPKDTDPIELRLIYANAGKVC